MKSLSGPGRRGNPPAKADEEGGDASSGIDMRQVKELAKVMAQYELAELELESGRDRIRLRRGVEPHVGHSIAPPAVLGARPAAHAAASVPVFAEALPPGRPAAAAPAAAEAPGNFITSPFVGTFYRSPSPETPAFGEVGQRIKKGQVLCIVEAMKLMNEIESEVDGTILEVLVENAQPVEYGERLFRIGP